MLTTNNPKINRKIYIIAANTNQIAIAKKLQVSRQSLNNELRGIYRSEKIRAGICEIIGVSKEDFWPEFYPNNNGGNGDGAQAT